MKKLLILWMLALLPCWLFAQNDKQAEVILDKTLEVLFKNSGIRADFEGNANGFLLLKGDKFYLNNGNIQSWYDGKTQWSYVADTEEVNISNPTPEELTGINPYYMLSRYKSDFNYQYKGSQKRNGVMGHEIILTPKHSESQEVIHLFISKTNQPLAIRHEHNGNVVSEIQVTSFQTNQKLEDGMFSFNKTLFPNAEIIDLR